MTEQFWKLALTAATLIGMAQPAAAAEIMEIPSKTNKNGGKQVIAIIGEIEAGDANKFRKIAIKYPKAMIVLSSDGGMVAPSLEIGRIIHMMGYGTMVITDTTCSSACALIWLAGSPRAAEKTAKIGFHASYRLDNKQAVEDGMANAVIGRYLAQINISEAGVMAATAARPDQMLWLDTDDPGAEGISYETYTSNNTARRMAKAPPPLVRIERPAPPIQTTPVRAALAHNKMFGAWRYAVLKDGIFSITTGDPENTSHLGYVCGGGEACTYMIRFTKTCTPTNDYEMEYRVDDGSKTSFELTCNKSGKSLTIKDVAKFNGAISGGSKLIIYGETPNDEVFTTRFSLIGRDSAIAALENSGKLQRINQ